MNFERYKQLQRQFDYKFHGVQLSLATTFSLASIADGKEIIPRKRLFKYLFTSFDLKNLNFDKSNNTVLSTYRDVYRKDYIEVYKYVTEQLGDIVSVNYLCEFKYRFCFHPFLICKIFLIVLYTFRKESIGIFSLLRYVAECVFYCNNILALEKLDLNGIKKYLAFENALEIENIITQYMKTKGVKTYSLCEGFYKAYMPPKSIDAVAHENMVTEGLICWGEFSKDEFSKIGISEDRLVIGGYPRNVSRCSFKENNSFKRCVVLMALESLAESNFNLLKLLSTYTENIQFSLKLHPSNNYDEYKKRADMYGIQIIDKSKTLQECIDNDVYDFAIAVNTTTYYECLLKGVPCFRYKEDCFNLYYGYDDIFCNQIELDSLIEDFKSKNISEYAKDVEQVVRYVIGYGINNYKAILG